MNYRFLVIGILLGGFAIIGASVYIGYAVIDTEVVANAYEAGLKFEETIKRQKELGWTVELPRLLHAGNTDSTEVTATVKDRTGAALSGATVEVELNRMGSRNIRTYKCTGGKEGLYATQVNFDATGYWEAKVRVAHLNDSLIFDEKINVVQ
jgi:nitrogen fixation protein FixH